jgi:hypothetical protein
MNFQLNHLHIVSEDKLRLAKWYCENLGFKIIADIEALGEAEGPVFVSGDDGRTGITIFTKRERHKGAGTTVIPAFEVLPESLIHLYKKYRQKEDILIYDHLIFFSIYVFDGDQNKLEIMSMQYEKMRELLKKEGIPSRAINPSATT